jgi:hypothetical protein
MEEIRSLENVDRRQGGGNGVDLRLCRDWGAGGLAQQQDNQRRLNKLERRRKKNRSESGRRRNQELKEGKR